MATSTVPVIRRRWRLKISMEEAGLTSASMAEELGVSRATITRWFADDEMPIRSAYLKAWAARTDVPYEWLTGAPVTDPTDPGLPIQPTVTKDDFAAHSGLAHAASERHLVGVSSGQRRLGDAAAESLFRRPSAVAA